MTFEPNVIVTDAETARLLARGRALQAQALRRAFATLGRGLLAALSGPAAPRPHRPLTDRRRVLRMAQEPIWH
ncbi:hypothetical protein SAMN06265365_10244 [Tistlia consotensis]|uniref:Uncharacterized protein n=1 Tax=Tistlia consotensis USBA 355 TaxID=560819 RepID=A0A1Y6BHQ7_9PROT|nr:hypothetical protein [Tistlia consotensis]SMF09792.1 hypothetical protein SAMN05428998_104272 [Tistlia consotensis USBA 355]SNR34253.1 hypothetical protein SAMN06265365_10244 [Tistlia consotensis]